MIRPRSSVWTGTPARRRRVDDVDPAPRRVGERVGDRGRVVAVHGLAGEVALASRTTRPPRRSIAGRSSKVDSDFPIGLDAAIA